MLFLVKEAVGRVNRQVAKATSDSESDNLLYYIKLTSNYNIILNLPIGGKK